MASSSTEPAGMVCSSESPSSSMASSSTEPADTMADRKRSDIAIDIETMLLDNAIEAESTVRTECSIYKVRDQIRKLNEDVYIPKFVSIGPFHRSSENIRKMEIIKKKYFKEFLKRSQTNLDSLVSRVEELEPQVRGCYSENIEYSKEEFVKMILVDAGFILEFVYRFHHEEWTKDDALQGKTWLINDIIEDLHLLGNQLPFFVIEQLSDLAFPTFQGHNRGRFRLIFSFLSLVVWDRHKQMEFPGYKRPILHFTDLLRELCLQPPDLTLPERLKMITMRSATELHELGVKFKAGRRSQRLLDLRFLVSDGILQIPELTVNAGTEKLFRNMIALEDCHYPLEPYITDYVFLLSCLIKTDEDADFLIKNWIIVNNLDSSNNVRRLFYSLGKSTTVVSFRSAYGQLCEDLNVFCNRPKRRWKAALRRDYYWDLKRTYCKTPLQTLATLGGILLIILTVIQAVCSILQMKMQVK